jgi:hypothetical protein
VAPVLQKIFDGRLHGLSINQPARYPHYETKHPPVKPRPEMFLLESFDRRTDKLIQDEASKSSDRPTTSFNSGIVFIGGRHSFCPVGNVDAFGIAS